ncbi:MAG: hypothetical protein ACRDJX_05465 [Solirubrobacteraceae bacterium]
MWFGRVVIARWRAVTCAAVLCVVLVVALAPVTASGAASGFAATHAYIQANYALARADVARIAKGEARVQALNSQLARECPGAGAGSPETEATEPMSYEVAVALWALSYGSDAGAIRTFLAAVKPLHWGSSRVTRIAHGYAVSLHELSTLAVPDLCTDVRAWTASGFSVVPANVVQLDKRVEAIEGRSIPSRLLAPFERGSDASVAARTRRLERKLAENEFMVGQTDLIEVTGTLGLPE